MRKKWPALCAAVLAAQALTQAGGAKALALRVRNAVDSGELVTATLTLELGSLPETGTAGTSASAASVPAAEPSPEPTPGPSPAEPVPTDPTAAGSAAPEADAADEPAASEVPAAPAEAGQAAEIVAFTDTPGVEVKNRTGQEVDVQALLAEGLTQRLPAEGPQILIIHTHGTEAYDQSDGDAYEVTDPYRTVDAAHSVVRVGDELQEALSAWGLRVVHDRGLYDYPSYTGSYARSGASVEAWLAQYPGIAVVIDLHRDAVGSDDVVYKTQAALPGESSAQVMLVMGTGENGLEHPCWRENLKLALAMQSAMDEKYPTLTRPVNLVGERYNQHLTRGSLILEVGSSGNTLSEALCAVRLFADAVGPLLQSLAAQE